MVEIRLVNNFEEKERLVDLHRASFNTNMSPELWDWKYLQNPLVSTDPKVIVALDNGKIVGARPFLLFEMWIKNKKVRTAQHSDTMVHPEYRNRGIFNRMGRFAIEYLKENEYTLSYGFPGLQSRSGFLTQGWRVVAPTEVLFWPVHIQKIISRKLKSKFLGNGIGIIYDILNTRMTETFQPSSAFQVEVFDQFNEELTEVDTLRDESVIDLVRSETNLRWRFDWHPQHRYKYIIAKRDGKLWGYTVVSVREKAYGLVYGIIIDYLVKNRDIVCFQVLIQRALEELGKSNCDIIFMWAWGDAKLKEQLLTHFSFKSSFRFLYKKVFSYGYLDAILLDERLAESVDIYDKENWQVTYAYRDTI